MRPLLVIDSTAPEPFAATWAVQEALVNEKIEDRAKPDAVVLVEHEPIFTVGRGVAFQQSSDPKIAAIPWQEIGRGGQATYHGPGQLVAYPVFDLEEHGKDVHLFLRRLEAVTIAAVKSFGLEATTKLGFTGVWISSANGELKKFSSIGIGVRRWISYHGMAINLTNDLGPFRAISPCGQDGAVMTSIAEICAERGIRPPSMNGLKTAFLAALREEFKFVSEHSEPELAIGLAEGGANPDGSTVVKREPRPPWLRVRAPGSPQFLETQEIVRKLKLVTVCEEARCPNMGECWSHHTATFMIMGEQCTRRCSFCSVKDGTLDSLNPLDPLEPHRVGMAVKELGLEHVVITSVNRDDLPDMGSIHFDKTIRSIAKHSPNCNIELLIPDMRGDRELVKNILQSGMVKVLNHNIETVPRLYRTVRPGSSFKRSLNVLRWAKELCPTAKTKSGVMVGLGETREEVLEVMVALREAGIDIMTIGQYLQPSAKQLPVERFVTPEEFADYEREGYARGFAFVESGPLVRSSYHAWRHAEGAEKVVCNL